MALEDAASEAQEGSSRPPVERSETPAEVTEQHSETPAEAPAEQPTTPADPETKELEEELDDEIADEEAEHEHERQVQTGPAKGWFFASIILTMLLAVIAGVTTDSAIVYTVAGLLPTVVCIIIFVALLDGHYKDVLFWLAPLAVCLLFLAVGPWLNATLNNQLDVPALTAVNLILSYLILFIGQGIEYLARPREGEVTLESEFEPEQLDKYIHTIEDKCKAINFVIGRVYRESRGGSKALREKIKVPSEWYNEFNDITTKELKEKKEFALLLLQKIEAQLKMLLMPEKDVFSHDEIKRLDLAHDANGYDRIIDVLAVNDRDPVEDYFLGAMDFCKKVTEGLQRG